jgi:hypothetical protein
MYNGEIPKSLKFKLNTLFPCGRPAIMMKRTGNMPCRMKNIQEN